MANGLPLSIRLFLFINPSHFWPPKTVPFRILLCLTPNDFTCQGKSLSGTAIEQLKLFNFIQTIITAMPVVTKEVTLWLSLTSKLCMLWISSNPLFYSAKSNLEFDIWLFLCDAGFTEINVKTLFLKVRKLAQDSITACLSIHEDCPRPAWSPDLASQMFHSGVSWNITCAAVDINKRFAWNCSTKWILL